MPFHECITRRQAGRSLRTTYTSSAHFPRCLEINHHGVCQHEQDRFFQKKKKSWKSWKLSFRLLLSYLRTWAELVGENWVLTKKIVKRLSQIYALKFINIQSLSMLLHPAKVLRIFSWPGLLALKLEPCYCLFHFGWRQARSRNRVCPKTSTLYCPNVFWFFKCKLLAYSRLNDVSWKKQKKFQWLYRFLHVHAQGQNEHTHNHTRPCSRVRTNTHMRTRKRRGRVIERGRERILGGFSIISICDRCSKSLSNSCFPVTCLRFSLSTTDTKVPMENPQSTDSKASRANHERIHWFNPSSQRTDRLRSKRRSHFQPVQRERPRRSEPVKFWVWSHRPVQRSAAAFGSVSLHLA